MIRTRNDCTYVKIQKAHNLKGKFILNIVFELRMAIIPSVICKINNRY